MTSQASSVIDFHNENKQLNIEARMQRIKSLKGVIGVFLISKEGIFKEKAISLLNQNICVFYQSFTERMFNTATGILKKMFQFLIDFMI